MVPIPVKQSCCIANICFDCYPAFDDPILDDSIKLGHTLTAVCLWFISICNLIKLKREIRDYDQQLSEHSANKDKDKSDKEDQDKDKDKKNKKKKDKKDKDNTIVPVYPWMRVIQVFYPFVTGWFALFRVMYQIGKPLLIAAAVHNLCEWGLISFAYFKTPTKRYFGFVFAATWIWFVISSVVMIPKFPWYALAEQATGIAIDIWLPITWFNLYRQTKEKEERFMFGLAFWAHTIHLFFTILPLVVENFVVGKSYYLSFVLEFCIYFSSPITHSLYSIFTTLYQKKCNEI